MLKRLSAVLAFVFAFGMFYGCSSERIYDESEVLNTSVGINSEESAYEICFEGGEVVLYYISGNEKSLVKKRKVLPLRKKDEEMLKKGIKVKELEEALGIFEDFAN